MTTDDLVLIELLDGNYVPVHRNLSRTFRGLSDAGDLVVDGPADLPRAYPAHLDSDDYRLSMRCTECGTVADDLTICDGCEARLCRCDTHDCPNEVPPWPSNR